MGMCAELGCFPSELLIEHPNMTEMDKSTMTKYIAVKEARLLNKIARMFGGSGSSGPVPMSWGNK